jgi:hypothetical protein
MGGRHGGAALRCGCGHPEARRALHEQNRLSNGFRPYREMKDLGEWRWTAPDGTPAIPFMHSLVTRKAR